MKHSVGVVGAVLAAVALAWACGGETSGGTDASTSSAEDGAVSSDASASGNDANSTADGNESDAHDTVDANDGGCFLPADTCDDNTHLRVHSNLRSDAGATGAGCAWDETVVDCNAMGGEVCFGGQCTTIVR